MRRDPAESATRRERFEATALPLLDAVHAAARRLTRGSAADAADLTQETYLRAYRTFAGFTPGTNCKAWLLTILYSIFVNRYHRAKLEPEVLEPADLERRLQALVRDGTDEETRLIARLDGTSAEVRAAVDALPDALRVVVLLVDVEELSYEEAARAIGCPVGTVRSRLSRARRRLCVALAEFARGAGYRSEEVAP